VSAPESQVGTWFAGASEMSARIHRLVLWGLASLMFVGCDSAKNDGAVDGSLTDEAACDELPIYCAQGGPSGTGVACGGLLSPGTCVGGGWTCPKGMVDQRDCTCGEPGLACASQVCTNSGPVCLDGGADADAGSPVECRGQLGEVGQRCPAMFDGSPENAPPCTESGTQQVWSCDDVVALSLGLGAHGVDCYYGSSSHALIGAMAFNDTNTLCEDSFTQSAGEVPTAACRFPPSMPSFYRPCSGG